MSFNVVAVHMRMQSSPLRLCRGHRLVDAAVFEAIPFRSAIADGCTHVLVLNNLPKVGAHHPCNRPYRPCVYPNACMPTSSSLERRKHTHTRPAAAGGARDVQRLVGGAGRGCPDCGEIPSFLFCVVRFGAGAQLTRQLQQAPLRLSCTVATWTSALLHDCWLAGLLGRVPRPAHDW